jgi:hypothetical protein
MVADQLVFGAFVVSIIFIMIGHIYKNNIQSILKQPLITLKEVVMDWWSVMHFLLFAFFGFVKPGYPLSFFTIGVLFEIFEDGMSSDINTQLINCPRKGILSKIMCNGIQDGYWYGKADDIFSNLIGYVVGQSIRTTFYKDLII